jgi:hypothetical protein
MHKNQTIQYLHFWKFFVSNIMTELRLTSFPLCGNYEETRLYMNRLCTWSICI